MLAPTPASSEPTVAAVRSMRADGALTRCACAAVPLRRFGGCHCPCARGQHAGAGPTNLRWAAVRTARRCVLAEADALGVNWRRGETGEPAAAASPVGADGTAKAVTLPHSEFHSNATKRSKV